MYPRETQHRIVNLAAAGAVDAGGPSETPLARRPASFRAKPGAVRACGELRQTRVAGWVRVELLRVG